MLFDRYGGKAIVVTGALGMIGSHVVKALALAGYQVIPCDFAEHVNARRYLELLRLEEIIDPIHLFTWLDSNAGRVGAIVHLGAISDTMETNLELLDRNNVVFSMELWRRAAQSNWPFIYASSAATYGSGEHGFVDSEDLNYLRELRPLNAYGASKNTVDLQILKDVQSGFPAPRVWAGLKFFNVYGPNEDHKGDMRSIVAKIVPQILAGQPVKLFRSHHPDYPDGRQKRDFIYVKDAVRPILEALTRHDLSGVFNVGTGQASTFLDLVTHTFNALGRDPYIEYIDLPEKLRGAYQYFTKADVAKARLEGLHDVRFTLQQGVRDYVLTLVQGMRSGSNAL